MQSLRLPQPSATWLLQNIGLSLSARILQLMADKTASAKRKERFANIKETAQEAKEWVQQHGEKLHVILETALESDD